MKQILTNYYMRNLGKLQLSHEQDETHGSTIERQQIAANYKTNKSVRMKKNQIFGSTE